MLSRIVTSSRTSLLAAATASSAPLEVDIAVVGGGAVGAATAAAFAQNPATSHLATALFDSRATAPAFPAPGSPPKHQVWAIAEGPRAMLQRLGVWQHIDATGRVGRMEDIGVADRRGPPALGLAARDVRAAQLASVVEADALVAAAWQVAREAGVKVRMGGRRQSWWRARVDSVLSVVTWNLRG